MFKRNKKHCIQNYKPSFVIKIFYPTHEWTEYFNTEDSWNETFDKINKLFQEKNNEDKIIVLDDVIHNLSRADVVLKCKE